MRASGRLVLLAACVLLTALGCSVNELVGSGALDTTDAGRKRDGGDRDDDGGDDDLVLSPTFERASDAGAPEAQGWLACPNAAASDCRGP
jgi:hypothetical protein